MVDDEVVVIADASGPAVVRRGEDVGADLFGGCEVEEGVVDGADGAGGDEVVVDFDVAGGVWHVESVVEDGGGVGVGEGPEVPVDVVHEHEGSGFVEGDGYNSRCPSRSSRDGKSCV